MEILALEEKTMKDLVTFSSVEELNEAVGQHKKHMPLSKTEKEIFFVISQYACKFTGVCYLSKQKIAEAAGFKSRRTAIRACNKLERFGMIKQYETRRVKGDKRRSVNIIVIQPFEDISQLTKKSQGAVTMESHKKNLFSYPPKQNSPLMQVTEAQVEESHLATLRNQIPSVFFNVFVQYLDAKQIYEVYGIFLRAKKSAQAHFLLEDYYEDYIDAFENAHRLHYWGKVQNFEGYLFKACLEVSKKIKDEIHADHGDPYEPNYDAYY